MVAFCAPLPVLARPRVGQSCAMRLSGRRTSVLRRERRPTTMCEGKPAEPSPQPAPAPDGGMITAALELTFRAVWVQLMTSGVGQGYEEAIEQFIVACATAYKAGYSLTALKFELATNDRMGEFALNATEKDTRMIWMALVYSTLCKFKFESVNPPPPVEYDLKGSKVSAMLSGLGRLVDNCVEAARKGYTLQTFKMELQLKDAPIDEKKDENEIRMTNAQKNLRSQWSRIVFATINILPESLKGFNSAKS